MFDIYCPTIYKQGTPVVVPVDVLIIPQSGMALLRFHDSRDVQRIVMKGSSGRRQLRFSPLKLGRVQRPPSLRPINCLPVCQSLHVSVKRRSSGLGIHALAYPRPIRVSARGQIPRHFI